MNFAKNSSKYFVLSIAMVTLASSSFAQNVSGSRFRASDKDSDAAAGEGMLASVEALAGTVVSFTQIRKLVGKNGSLAEQARLKSFLQDENSVYKVMSLDLDANKFDKVWKRALPREYARVESADATLSNLESQIYGRSTLFMDSSDLRGPARAARIDWNNARSEFKMKRIQFFDESSSAYQSSVGAEVRSATRVIAQETLEQAKMKTIRGSIGTAVGVYMIVDSAYKMAILIDGQNPGVAPLIFSTK